MVNFGESLDGTLPELRVAIVAKIKRTYHRRHHHRAIRKLIPVELETAIGYDTLAIAG